MSHRCNAAYCNAGSDEMCWAREPEDHGDLSGFTCPECGRTSASDGRIRHASDCVYRSGPSR